MHEPWGAHPSIVQGYYNRDHAFFSEYHLRTRTAAGFQEWYAEWVRQVPTRAEYTVKVGEERLKSLKAKEHRYAAQVDYGY